MEGMPGQNRVGEDGKPKCKNYCMVNANIINMNQYMSIGKNND